MTQQNASTDKDIDLDFDVLEATEAAALEEMGASSTIDAGSTCSSQTIDKETDHDTANTQADKISIWTLTCLKRLKLRHWKKWVHQPPLLLARPVAESKFSNSLSFH